MVAGYQAAARGWAGAPWTVQPDRSIGFSLLLRPPLPVDRPGWFYVAAAVGLADVRADVLADALGPARISWPDTVRAGSGATAAVAVHSDGDASVPRWVVVSALLTGVEQPRGPLVARAVAAIERQAGRPAAEVLERARAQCDTLGRGVRARIIPVGPRGIVVTGTAVDLAETGALVVETAAGRRQPVLPQDTGIVELV
jgi:BirA family biotin operon repressor/biotin-[acetyl-CoA-carboxylase] ligase